MDTEKKARGNAMELILSVCSGLRKVPAKTPEEIAYNNALGDVFDYIIKNEQDCLMPGTVQGGTWVQEQNIQNAPVKPTITIQGLTVDIEWDVKEDPFPNAADQFVPATYITVWADYPGYELTYDCTVNLQTKEVKIPEIEDPGFDIFVGKYIVIDNKAYPVYNKKKRTSKNQFWIGELDRAMLSDVTTYLNDRKQLRLEPIAEGPDEQDFYFCPTCYAIVGVHDEDAIEHSSYCPDCGQKLSWQNYHEKRMKNRIEQLMQAGILTAEKREGMLFCCLSKEISFVAPMPAIYDDEHIVDSISIVLRHPGAFGVSKDIMESVWKILWNE